MTMPFVSVSKEGLEVTLEVTLPGEVESETDPTFGIGLFMLGVEYGYKQCERGHNIQMTQEKARRLYLGEKP